jgi:hypothetical protein
MSNRGANEPHDEAKYSNGYVKTHHCSGFVAGSLSVASELGHFIAMQMVHFVCFRLCNESYAPGNRAVSTCSDPSSFPSFMHTSLDILSLAMFHVGALTGAIDIKKLILISGVHPCRIC